MTEIVGYGPDAFLARQGSGRRRGSGRFDRLRRRAYWLRLPGLRRSRRRLLLRDRFFDWWGLFTGYRFSCRRLVPLGLGFLSRSHMRSPFGLQAFRSVIRMIATTFPSLNAFSFVPLLQVQT